MPSSTSSSDADPPDAPWGRTWALAAALAVAALAGLELTARARGYRPSLVDDAALWSSRRERLEGAGPATIALLGASRIVTNVVPGLLEGEFPGRTVVQLGVEGKSPVAALRDLADDPGFAGLAVVCVMPEWLHEDQPTQEAYVRHYRRDWGLLDRSERWLRTRLEEAFALARFRLNAARLRMWATTPPVNRYSRTTAERWTELTVPEDPADLRRVVERRLEHHRSLMARSIPGDRWLGEVDRLGAMAAAIRRRGGRVVFLRNVTGGGILELDERTFPRRDYWDVLAARVGAPTIHFADVPGMARLACFEGSHLDRDAAADFTRALAGRLRELGVVPAPSR